MIREKLAEHGTAVDRTANNASGERLFPTRLRVRCEVTNRLPRVFGFRPPRGDFRATQSESRSDAPSDIVSVVWLILLAFHPRATRSRCARIRASSFEHRGFVTGPRRNSVRFAGVFSCERREVAAAPSAFIQSAMNSGVGPPASVASASSTKRRSAYIFSNRTMIGSTAPSPRPHASNSSTRL